MGSSRIPRRRASSSLFNGWPPMRGAKAGSSSIRTTATSPATPSSRSGASTRWRATRAPRSSSPWPPQEGDITSPKRAYGAFDGTGLDELLKERGVDEVVITGQHTHICVRHSSYGARIRGYEVIVPRDAVCGFEGVDEQAALDYLEQCYGARITTVAELTGAPVAA